MALAPTCNFRCPEKKGTCFPQPCKKYVEPSVLAAAKWRLDQCRKTVREGELELQRRQEALRQAEIAAELAERFAPPSVSHVKGDLRPSHKKSSTGKAKP